MASERIFIVEDESIVALDLQNSLEKLGYAVIGQASRGPDAIQAVADLQPDLILMDVHLKGDMDGIETAEQIHAQWDIPVIFLTAHADEATLQRARQTEPFGYLLKPFDEHILDSNIFIALYKHAVEQKLRQSEARLRLSEEKYRSVVENSSDAIVLTDAEARIIEWNQAAEQITGLSREHVLNQYLWDIYYRATPEPLRTPELYTQQKEAVQALLTEQQVPEQYQQLENEIQAVDGQLRTIQSNTFIVFSEQGMLLASIMRDITQRRKSEAELRLLYQAVAQSANTIVITDPQGNIVYVNPKFEELTGYTAQEAIGQNPSVLKSGEHDQEFYKHLWGTITSGEVWRGEFHNRRKDGSLFWEWATIAPVIDARGNITHYIAIKEDITNRKAVEAAEEEQRQLAEALRSTAEALSSTLKYDAVMELILDNVGKVAPYDAVAVVLLDDGNLTVARHRGRIDADWEMLVQRTDLKLAEFPAFQEMCEHREPFIARDIPTEAQLPGFIATHWVRSFLGMPISSRDQVIGFLTLLSANPNFYSQTHADRLRAFASQAAVAIQNSRIYELTHYQSITDGLTGLYNSRYFFSIAQFEFDRAQRYESDLSVLMLDADWFKSVNDTYGHPVGDDVLRHIAQLIFKGLRKADVVARYGGEEFVMMMPETGMEEALGVADRLCKLIADTPVEVNGHIISVTVSIGVATLSQVHTDFNALVKCADDALYLAKGAGRNQAAVWKECQ